MHVIARRVVFSEALRLGLIEAFWHLGPVINEHEVFSEALRLGLIEAWKPGALKSAPPTFSEALRLGLIEAC